MTTHLKHALVLALAACLAACTVTDTPAPPLAGPSEMSLSLAITREPRRAVSGRLLADR